ncbi:MAG: threonine--tRNA ligase [Thermoprotei archaeon]|nr:MAG: threonine--tRNA ligase [Thermoprotei archaeon]
MKILLIHAETFEYEAKQKAIDQAEKLDGVKKEGSFNNVLVVFTTVEEGDLKDPSVINQAKNEILDVFEKVKAERILIYPYAHLSDKLAKPSDAIKALKELYRKLSSENIEVHRAPFGWYKRFKIHCYGHPLSELSRTIRPGGEVKKGYHDFAVMFPDGRVVSIEELDGKELPEDFIALLDAEVFKRKREGKTPTYLEICKKFGFEWEPMSDLGHMRYGPEATLMIEAVSEYAWMCARSIGIPVFKVKGTNMFNLNYKPVKQHAELFGDRLYQFKADDKDIVLRYAACHQQFAMIKDWEISYKNLPFGAFEVADSYRLEQPGELVLCFRLRKFYMPDFHIFCKDLEQAIEVSYKIHDKIYEEIRKLGRDYVSIYNLTRSFLERYKDYVKKLVEKEGKPVLLHFVPEGKYYWVINIEYNIIDELRRPREIGTFQIDIGNAQRFGIKYVDEKNQEHHPVIIHTAIIGSIERYIYAVFDTAVKQLNEGKTPMLPTWLAPIQVRIIPFSVEFMSDAEKIADILESHSIRVDIDDREETLSKKIREAEMKWIPYIVVIGKREKEAGTLSVRIRGKGQEKMTVEELIQKIEEETRGYPKLKSTLPKFLGVRPRYR